MLITVDICDCEKEPVVLRGKTSGFVPGLTSHHEMYICRVTIPYYHSGRNPLLFTPAGCHGEYHVGDIWGYIGLRTYWWRSKPRCCSLKDLQGRVLLNVSFLLDCACRAMLALLNISPHKPIQDISVSIAAKSSLTKMSASSGTETNVVHDMVDQRPLIPPFLDFWT